MTKKNKRKTPALKVVIITLKDYPERLRKLSFVVMDLLSIGCPVELFWGVNGKEITMSDTDQEHVKKLHYKGDTMTYDATVRGNKQGMHLGELGCAWSHYKVYQKLLSDPSTENYLVLEDDADMCSPLAHIEQAFLNLPPNFDILRLAPSIWQLFSRTEAVNPYFWKYAKRNTNCATAYAVSKSGAKKIIEYMNGSLSEPADDVLSNLYIRNDDTQFFASDVPFFLDPLTQRSIIYTVGLPPTTESEHKEPN